MTSEQQNQKLSSSKAAASQEIDKTVPSGEPIIDRPDQLRAEAAARMGQLDGSEIIGAEVDQRTDHMAAGKPPVAGDPDVLSEQAKVVGDEAVGGTAATPDQSNVDDIGEAFGIETPVEHPVRITREMHRRDVQRYELDPDSKEPDELSEAGK